MRINLHYRRDIHTHTLTLTRDGVYRTNSMVTMMLRMANRLLPLSSSSSSQEIPPRFDGNSVKFCFYTNQTEATFLVYQQASEQKRSIASIP